MKKCFAVVWLMMPWTIITNILLSLSHTTPIIIYTSITGVIFFVYAMKKVFRNDNGDDDDEENDDEDDDT